MYFSWPFAVYMCITVTSYNGRDGVSNHQRLVCLLNRWFRRRLKKPIKAPRHWSLWGEFTGDPWIPAKRPVTRKRFPFDDVIMGNPECATGRHTPASHTRHHRAHKETPSGSIENQNFSFWCKKLVYQAISHKKIKIWIEEFWQKSDTGYNYNIQDENFLIHVRLQHATLFLRKYAFV